MGKLATRSESPHADSGIDSQSKSSFECDSKTATLPTSPTLETLPAPETAAPSKKQVKVQSKKISLEDDDDDFVFKGDLDKVPPPKILGGGPTFIMADHHRRAAIFSLNENWIVTEASMIPKAAEEHFPAGPTAGPYRTTPNVRDNNPRAGATLENKAGKRGGWFKKKGLVTAFI